MHGELAVLRCEACDARVRDVERVEPDSFLACAGCGHARLRPDVVWFGEMPYHLDAIETALVDCTHFLAVGTSGVVYPAAGFLQLARERGARTWVQALERPDNLSAADEFLAGRAVDALPAFVRAFAEAWKL
jgi:NAD-dependent deacetylase